MKSCKYCGFYHNSCTSEQANSCKNLPELAKGNLLKSNLKQFLSSKSSGGLYGLTISSEEFIPELIEVIKMSSDNEKFVMPQDDYNDDDLFY